MKTVKIVIPGNPITKKNSQRIISAGGRSFIIPSARYKQYEREAIKVIKHDGEPIRDRVNVKILYFMETRRRVDLTNLLEATDDILVHCGVLEDDNYKIIAAHDGSRIYHDKENPRAEIYISDFVD